MKIKRLLAILTAILMIIALAGCGTGGSDQGDKDVSGSEKTDPSSLKGTTIRVYTHMGQRVLGEEKR